MAYVKKGASKKEAIRCRRQVGMVIDLNKCIGCQTCVMACKTAWTSRAGTEHMRWMNVTTYPGAGCPRNWSKLGGGYKKGEPAEGSLTTMEDCGSVWSFNVEVFYGGKATERGTRIRPFDTWYKREPTWGYNWDEDQGGGAWPNPYFFYFPRLCNHCSNPPCVKACPHNALYKREQDGIVLIDQKRCVGDRLCIEACPYKAIYYNPLSRTSEKCIFCYPRRDVGTANACVRQCPGRTRHLGFLDEEKGHVRKLVKEWKVALPLRADFGTEPNVFYIPPWSALAYENGELTDKMRIPMPVLEKLFGPDVSRAVETLSAERKKVVQGGKSELMDILISRNWFEMLGGLSRPPLETTQAEAGGLRQS